MYTGTHRLVKIYQGMKTRTKVAVVTGVLALGLAAGTLPSLAASSPTYADSSVTVSSIFPWVPSTVVQHTLTLSATGFQAATPATPILIPVNVGDLAAVINPVVTGDGLIFTAGSQSTFQVSSANVPAGIVFNSVVNAAGTTDTLTATVTGSITLPVVNATVTVKATDTFGDVSLDTVVFTPNATNTFNVRQVEDAIPVIAHPLTTNNNATGAVDFTVPAGDELANLGNAPAGVAIAGNSIVGINAVPGKYSNVTADITDAGGAVSVENFALTVKGAIAVYNGPKLSQGHAVKVNAVRENVYFVQSGAASYDEFTIVGPGKINGHKGWVNAHLGLNTAVYGGLEANHGYTVYYTPVTGPGSETPIPGSHYGYVYFVS
jgi:hypothetical protein